MKLAKFYHCQKEFQKVHHKLKQTSCPHCKRTETLILHGHLYGYTLNPYGQRIIRGKRIFCSNRNRKDGCGKTFSILKADKIKRFIIQTSFLWKFLKNIARNINIFQAFHLLKLPLKTTTIYRLYKRMYYNQHKIRRLLLKRCPAPKNINHKNPLVKTIIHIKLSFKGHNDPIAVFQSTFQTSFL